MIHGIGERLRQFGRRLYSYTRRHAGFLLVDMLSFVLAYFLSILARRLLNIPVYRGDLVIRYGFVAALVYLVMEYVTRNLNGIMFRGMAREAERLLVQMGVSWSAFTVILYLHKEAHEFSRSIYLIAFVFCFLFILAARTFFKMLMRYSRQHEKNAPSLLIVCEAPKAQKVLERLLPGSFGNDYRIRGLVMNPSGEADYHDWYPHAVGLEHLEEFLRDRQVQDAYVELDGEPQETDVIRRLLEAGVSVHRSLGDSRMDYLYQRVDRIGGKSVITIEDLRSSLSGRLDEWLRERREKKAGQKDAGERNA